MQIACVLKAGPELQPAHLYLMVDSLVEHNPGVIVRCLTDLELNHPNIKPVPLQHCWPGWWSKMELFRPGVCEGPTLYFDIDTLVVGSLRGYQVPGFTMLADVYRKGDFGSGILGWNETPHHLYESFRQCPAQYMARYRTRDKWGDQAFIRDHLGHRPHTFGREFRSYKVYCRNGVPQGTKVVYFHGKPRPWNVKLCH